jgi:hypothetical protein
MKSSPLSSKPVALSLTIAFLIVLVLGNFSQTKPNLTVDRLTHSEDNNAMKAVIADGQIHLPLGFEANRGQAPDDIKFVGRANASSFLFKRNEVLLSIHNRDSRKSSSSSRGSVTRAQVGMKFEGANLHPDIAGQQRRDTRANYFIGNDPSKWVRGIDTYSSVAYSAIYPGIDLLFYGNQNQLEYDFKVAPGANPSDIKLRFEGADKVEFSKEGDLILQTTAGNVSHNAPVAYQEIAGSRHDVAAKFEKSDDGLISFKLGAYDHNQPLVIDPVLIFSTYLGGPGDDACRGIVADPMGNAYLIGDSFSASFIPRATDMNSDIFIGKLNSNGLILSYTFFGGDKNDTATGLTVDSTGSVYMAGSTESTDFPILSSFGLALQGPSDAFVVKLTAALDQFFYSTIVGGSGAERGISVAADSGGNAYISGQTTSADFPTFAAVQSTYGGGDSDAFVSKIAANGQTLIYSTFLGGTGNEDTGLRSGISVDDSGNASVSGDTASGDFPVKNALRATKSGSASSSDGFVAKLNSSGSAFVYSTYLGGSDDDFALGLAGDSAGNAYVTGRTKSTAFTGSSVTRPSNTNSDAFVAKINPDGSAFSYLTFIGGTGDESGNAIAIDGPGNAVIGGTSTGGATTIKSIQSFSRGGTDAFVARLGTNGSVTFSTYIGGSDEDSALAVDLTSDGFIYVGGFTKSTDFLISTPLVHQNAGKSDIFIARIDPTIDSNRPVLLQAVVSGKNLIVYGQGFDSGAVLLVNDEQVKTRNEDPDPTQVLFAKKAAKRIGAGHTAQLQVQNAGGKKSNFLFFTIPQ